MSGSQARSVMYVDLRHSVAPPRHSLNQNLSTLGPRRTIEATSSLDCRAVPQVISVLGFRLPFYKTPTLLLSLGLSVRVLWYLILSRPDVIHASSPGAVRGRPTVSLFMHAGTLLGGCSFAGIYAIVAC